MGTRQMSWYPTRELLVWIHDKMIEKFGGHKGVRRSLDLFDLILKDVRLTDGTYRKAAVLLTRLIAAHIFEDANKRTAYTLTKTFLEMNRAPMRITNEEEALKFLRKIREYHLDQVEEWLKHGRTKERP